MDKETLPTNQDVDDQEEATSEMMQQLEEFLTEGEYDYQLPKRGDIHAGVVIEIGSRGAIVDAGFKRDGIVPAADLDRLDDETLEGINPGDEIAVAVTKPQDKEGRLILSIYQALIREDWHEAERMMEEGELYEGEISGYNRGGLLVPFGRIRGFIPASHTVGMPRGLKGEERRERLADMVGDKVGLKIIEVDRHRRRLILSQRQARRAWQKIQRKRVMEELTEGETVSGTVTGITDFGAFVDLGGADGLIHISELSWRQVDDPREVVEVDDDVDVHVLNLDWERTRIALSLKRLQPNPWSRVASHYEVDQLIEGTVSRVLDFGAFVQLGLGVEGLLHVSEMTGASQLSPTEILETGQKVLVKIIGIDTHKQRITLSARQVQRDQWELWMAEHKIALEEEEARPPEPEEEGAIEPEAVEEEAVATEEPVERAEEISEPEAAEEEPEPDTEPEPTPDTDEEAEEVSEPEAEPEPEATDQTVEEEISEPEAVEEEPEPDTEPKPTPETDEEVDEVSEPEAEAEPEASDQTTEEEISEPQAAAEEPEPDTEPEPTPETDEEVDDVSEPEAEAEPEASDQTIEEEISEPEAVEEEPEPDTEPEPTPETDEEVDDVSEPEAEAEPEASDQTTEEEISELEAAEEEPEPDTEPEPTPETDEEVDQVSEPEAEAGEETPVPKAGTEGVPTDEGEETTAEPAPETEAEA
ncbi:MAG: S1 RNA-binding domain-containing protein [Anaerolineae bacterium]|jgi:small subunit ribosomal protein S1